MSWTDDELDKVFRDAAEQPVFEYQASYFQDIEKQLPIKKGRKIAWYWWTANVFIIGFATLLFTGNWSPKNERKSAEVETSKVDNDLPIVQSTALKSQHKQSTNVATITSVHSGVNISQTPQNQLVGKSSTPNNVTRETQPPTSIRITEELPKGALSFTENNESTDASLLLLELIPFGFENQQLMSNYYSLKKNKNSFYIGMNTGVEQAWASEVDVPSSLNSTLSLEFGYRIPLRNVQFSAGLAFEATKLGDLRIKERTKLYGFGSSILENSYKFNSIYSVLLPVELSTSFGRHSIGLGLVGEMKVFAHASHEKLIDGIRTSNATGFTNVDLFNRFGLSPKLTYALSLTEKLQLGLAVQTQLIQPLNSDRFIGVPTKLPISGQVFIKRSLKF